MAKRGRKSAAELEQTSTLIVDVSRRMPMPPPAELTDAQAAVWRDAVASMAGGWLPPGGRPVLIEYTRRVCRCRLLEAEIARFEMEWLQAEGGLERLDKLLAMADRESRAAVACARALRLTPQARVHPRTAGRASPPSVYELMGGRDE